MRTKTTLKFLSICTPESGWNTTKLPARPSPNLTEHPNTPFSNSNQTHLITEDHNQRDEVGICALSFLYCFHCFRFILISLDSTPHPQIKTKPRPLIVQFSRCFESLK